MFVKKHIISMVLIFMSQQVFCVDSGGNSVYIDQTNADQSTVNITQTGSNNTLGDPDSLLAPEFAIEGNTMLVDIVQDGMNNAITGNIVGGNTTADVTQTGNTNSTDITMGAMGTGSGTLSMTITGSNNTTDLNIGVTSNSSNYSNITDITGDSNTLTSNIDSSYTDNSIVVTGDSNTITTTQTGASGAALITGHNIELSTIGDSNTITILQDGLTNPNSAILNVTGSSATVNLIQH